MSRTDGAFAKMDDKDLTGSIGAQAGVPAPTEADLAFARNAASDVLTKGDKDSSQPWENPETGGARLGDRRWPRPIPPTVASAGIFWQATSMAARRAGCRARPASPVRAGGRSIR